MQQSKGLWPEYPFRDHGDWSLGNWLGVNGLSKTAIDNFLKLPWILNMASSDKTNYAFMPSFSSADELYMCIDQLPGGPPWLEKDVVMDEAPKEGKFKFYYRDPVACLAYLQANPGFRGHMNYVPVEQYADKEMTNRVYSEPHAAKWIHEIQAEYPEDSINGFFLASDDTHLTNFSGDKKMHPVLITSSHISKSVRAKPSRRGFMLMARIPDCKFAKTEFGTAAEAKTMPGILNAMLFHKCMKIALNPMESMDKKAVEMVDSLGDVRRERCFLAGYIGDLKEHKIIGCLNNDDCDKCVAEKHDLGNAHPCAPRTQQSILDKIHQVCAENPDASLWQFVQAAKAKRLFGVEKPFWEDLPHVDICKAIATDVLHGLHKAFKDHTATWTTNIIGDIEFDKCMWRLPKFPGFRHFSQGISKISQWSGRDLQRVFLGACLGAISSDAIKAIRSELDFIYTAQWKSLTTSDLQNMKKYNAIYHANKHVFWDLGGRKTEGYEIPKLHNRHHFNEVIELFGTTDNYNTETSERYHIDVAKRAWLATNHKDVAPQMLKWLDRQEKMYHQAAYLRWIDNNYEDSDHDLEPWGWHGREEHEIQPIVEIDEDDTSEVDYNKYKLAVKPQFSQQPLTEIAHMYELPDLEEKLLQFLKKENHSLQKLPKEWTLLDVWSSVKIREPPIITTDDDKHSMHRVLARLYTKNNNVPCFQTVLIDPNPESGETRDIGITGKQFKQ